METASISLDFAEPAFDLTLYADGVGVGCVLSLFKQFKGTGSGSLYGKIPLAYRDGKVAYGEGFLYNKAGEKGRLQIKDAGILTTGLAQAAGSRERLEAVKEALTDFHLDEFRLRLNPHGGESDTKLKLEIVGRPAKHPEARGVHLTVNIKGALQEIINLGLQLGGL